MNQTIHQIRLQLVSTGRIGTLNQINQFENIYHLPKEMETCWASCLGNNAEPSKSLNSAGIFFFNLGVELKRLISCSNETR